MHIGWVARSIDGQTYVYILTIKHIYNIKNTRVYKSKVIKELLSFMIRISARYNFVIVIYIYIVKFKG